MTARRIGRRAFVSMTARGAAATMAVGAGPLLRGVGQAPANEELRLAVIGFGVQGLIDASAALRVPGVRVVGAASCYDGHLARARELLGEQAILTRDYRRLLDSREVDAVIVATPNHWHMRACLDAIAAGKDVYCEKPLTLSVDEGARIVKAVRASDRVFQVGSQHTSSPHVIEARQLVAEGALGQVTQVKASWDTNNDISAWVKPIPADASESTIDWPRFQGPAPKKPFDARRVFRWRTYREYGGGLAGDVLVHIITAVHYVLNLDVPTLATAVGGRLMWKDERNVYDTITGGYEYPEGIVTVLGATQNNGYNGTQIELLGSKASMVLTFAGYTIYEEDSPANWRYTTNVWPKELREEYWRSKGLPMEAPPGPPQARAQKVLREWTAPSPAPGSPRVPHHMQHFIDCVRSRRTPVQDVTMGNNAAVTAHMADESYFGKRTIFFDRASRKIVTKPTS